MSNENYPIVELLLSIKNRADRAALANLRRGASDPFNNFEALSIIGRTLPDIQNNTFKNSMLVATLFAVNPIHINKQNIGNALRKVRNSLSVGQKSLDERFTLLLNSDYDDLPHHLVYIFRFLDNKGIGLDYNILFKNLKFWTHQDKFVQLEWAKGYWGKSEENEK